MSACLLYRPQGRLGSTGDRPRSSIVGTTSRPPLNDGKGIGDHTPRYGVTGTAMANTRRIARFYCVGRVLGRSAKLALWTVRRRASFYIRRRGAGICGLWRSLPIEGGAA